MRAVRVFVGLIVLSALFLQPNSRLLESAYADQSDLEKELPAQLRALVSAEETYGPESAETAIALQNLAKTYSKLAKYEIALLLQFRMLDIFEKMFGPEHVGTAKVLDNLAISYVHLARPDKALPLQQRALAIFEKTLGPEHPDTALALNNLAESYSDLAQYDRALSLQQRALKIDEKVLGPEHTNTAVVLDNLAKTYIHLAQYSNALSLQQRGLTIREKIFGQNHPATALALNNLAQTYSNLGQYDKALPLQQRALAIYEGAQGKEHPDTAVGLNNLALTYSNLGQYARALPLQERALAINEKVYGPKHPETALALNNLAVTYSYFGKYNEALSLQRQAVVIYQESLGVNHPYMATFLNNLATTYSHLSQNDKALQLQQLALDILVKVRGPDRPDIALTLGNLAHTYFELALYNKAFPMQQRALAIYEKSFGDEHPNTGLSWNNLAAMLHKTNRLDAAIFAGKRAVNVGQAARARVAKIGIAEAVSFSEKIRSQYEDLSSWLTEAGRISEAQQVLDMLKETEHFDFIRRASDSDPRKTRIGYTRSEQAWLPRYDQISSRLATLGAEQQALEKKAKLGLTDAEKTRQKQLLADLKVAQAAFTAYLDEMRTGFSKKGLARVAEVEESSEQSLKLMQATLKAMDPGAVLVRYYMTDTQVKIIVTTPGVQLARDATITPKELNSKIAAFNGALRDPKSNPLPLAQELYTALVGPITQDLQQAGATTVMLYLDGALRYLPFSALHDGQRYLVERWRMPIYTAVAKDKLREAATPQWTAAGMGVSRKWRDFAALPAVKQELDSVVKNANLLSWVLSRGALPGELFLDEQFTANSLKTVGQSPFSVVHIASHFRFSPGTEVNSVLLLGDGQELTLGDIRTQGYTFKNVDLLTLSACETGLGGGRDEQGREIEGFGVIAQQQGAKAVLATLWPVADQSTAFLMQEMYRQRQEKNLTKIEALRQAQLAVMGQKKYAHPFYWAPFILMGNWL